MFTQKEEKSENIPKQTTNEIEVEKVYDQPSSPNSHEET